MILYVCACVHACMRVHVRGHMCIHPCAHALACEYVHAHIFMCAFARVPCHFCLCMHTYLHEYVCACPPIKTSRPIVYVVPVLCGIKIVPPCQFSTVGINMVFMRLFQKWYHSVMFEVFMLLDPWKTLKCCNILCFYVVIFIPLPSLSYLCLNYLNTSLIL
jgi:hypothetical protein